MNMHRIEFSVAKFALLILILFVSCKSNNYQETDLHGSWKVVNWEIISSGQERNNQMDMSFEENGSYTVDYGSEKEVGEYWIANDFLHTTETDQAEKKVKILGLSQDTLSFQMNRGGELENVILVRSK